jgi:hypothetical protein
VMLQIETRATLWVYVTLCHLVWPLLACAVHSVCTTLAARYYDSLP